MTIIHTIVDEAGKVVKNKIRSIRKKKQREIILKTKYYPDGRLKETTTIINDSTNTNVINNINNKSDN